MRAVDEINTESVKSIERTLNDVDLALERMRSGTYRSCDLCGTEIDEELLVRDPLRTNCAAHGRLDG
jgi:RNA polymerase-binding transcription factor DksA